MINETVNNGFQPPARPAADRVAETAAPALPSAQQAEAAAERTAPDREQVQEAVSRLNDYVQNLSRTLSFRVEEATGRTVIEVYDSETEELIRQIPPEETLRLAETLETELPPGLFVKERA